MAGSVLVTGMILSAQPVGEYDRRLVLLTRELGKISAFARGVRRPTVSMSGSCQPFAFGKFTVYEGRDSYTVENAEISQFFAELRSDLNALYYGIYFCEFVEALTREGLEATKELKVLYRSLGALSKESIGKRLVRSVFELKELSVTGISPQVEECVHCRSKENLVWFHAKEGGCVCSRCVGGYGMLPVSQSTLYTMRYILATPIESLYTFTVKPEILQELSGILDSFVAIHVGRRFKSLEMLETIAE